MRKEEESCHYAVLEVRRESTPAEIKKAYKKKALKYHPDKNPSADAAVIFQRLTKAQEVLLDEKLRKEYDSQLRGKQQLKERAEKLDKRTKELRDQLQKREAAYKQSQEKQSSTKTASSSSSSRNKRKRDDDTLKHVKYSDATLKVTTAADKDDKRGKSSLTEEELREFFQEFGTIESIIVKKKRRVAYISFSSIRSAVAAMEANQVEKTLSRKQRQREWSVEWASGREPSMSSVETDDTTDLNTEDKNHQNANTVDPNLSSYNSQSTWPSAQQQTNFSDFAQFENKEEKNSSSGMSLEDLEALVFSKMQKRNKET